MRDSHQPRRVTKTSPLRCSSALTVSLDGDRVSIRSRTGQRFQGSRSLLEILATFAHPLTLTDGLARLTQRRHTTLDWVQASATILQLVDAGILETGEKDKPALGSRKSGYSSARIHIAMLNDRARTQAYIAALEAAVRPDSVVVDLGTGTGIMAATAARCGAKRVYAIEASGIANVARALYADNGFQDRITLLEGRSTEIELPERADILVSELIGTEALEEGALEYTRDAVARFLKPGAQLIPERLRVFAQPIELPSVAIGEHVFTEETVSTWADWYGLRFDVLSEAKSELPYRFNVSPANAAAWTVLGDPVELYRVDFREPLNPAVNVAQDARVTVPGRLNAVLSYFELDVGAGQTITTQPSLAAPDCHWRCPVWLVPEPFPVEKGDPITLSYRHGLATTSLICSRRAV